MQAILDAAWTHLLPGLRDGTAGGGSAQTELASRLRTLALPAYQAEPEPPAWSGWESQQFTVVYRDTVPEVERAITSVGVERAGAEVRVTLTEAANALSFVIGTNGWSVSSPADQFGKPIPVASAGGWSDNNRLHVEVIFLETPHRMDIECSRIVAPVRRGGCRRWVIARFLRCGTRSEHDRTSAEPRRRSRLIRARRGTRTPLIVGITGAVAVGKSTLAAALKEPMATWPEAPVVEVVCTDGFLLDNARLEPRGLVPRKGSPRATTPKRCAPHWPPCAAEPPTSPATAT